MTYYGAKELADSFRTVRKNTVIVAEEIPEERYGFKATPETRSIAEMLAHVAVSPRFQTQLHAVERLSDLGTFNFMSFFERLGAEEKQPRTKAQIIDLLNQEGNEFAGWLEGLSEEFLAEQVRMPPGSNPARKSRFELLLSAKEHEMHHRAQLMLIQRLLGQVPHLTRQMEAIIAEMRPKS